MTQSKYIAKVSYGDIAKKDQSKADESPGGQTANPAAPVWHLELVMGSYGLKGFE